MNQSYLFKQLKLFYWVIFAVLVLFAAISIAIGSIVSGALAWSYQDIETLKTIIILLALGGIPAGFIFHNKKVKKLPADMPISEKIKQFRNGFFLKIVTIEALGILALIGYLVSSDFAFLIIFLLLFVAYLLNIPSEERILEELESNEEEEVM